MAQTAVAADHEQSVLLRRSVLASMSGGVLEWYDFILYGSAVSVYLSPETYKRDIKNVEVEEDSPILQAQPNVDVG